MKRISAIVVDDEKHARDLIRGVLSLFEHNLEVIAEAENLPNAVRAIQELKPKIVFLDIDMPKFSGLQIKDFISEDVLVIYITAHSQHAIEALRLDAFDYLLKPIDINSLKTCVARIDTFFAKRADQEKTEQKSIDRKITVNTQQGSHFISMDDIFYIEAAAMYAIIHFESDQLIVSKPLKEFSFLEEHGFFRTHRSYLVNTQKVKRFSRVYGNEVIFENGMNVPLSRSSKENFLAFMNSLKKT